MQIKELLGVLALRKFIYDRQFREHINVNYFRGVYSSFADASAAAPKTKPLGYDHPSPSKMYKERTEQVYGTDYPVLFWIEKFKDIHTVFDFGGHIGIHFYSYARYLDISRFKRWLVCDVPEVLKEGRSFEKYRGDSALDFTDRVEECDGMDLFLANGSLQYLEWELHDKLKALRKMPKYIIVNMLPLHQKHSTITLQSIGTAFCPYYLRTEKRFVEGLEGIGYEFMDAWFNEEKACKIAFEPERSLSAYRGMVFRLKSAQ